MERYLELLVLIVGSWAKTINYVDGFAGPWEENASGGLADTSPHIAMTKLRQVRRDISRRQSPPAMRCLFIEKDAASFARLRASFADSTDVAAEALNGEFHSLIPRVQQFVRTGEKPFSFIFIDPTGWSGYGLNAIKPLLLHERVEVMINFMTKFVVRFVDDPQSDALETFVDLYGTNAYREKWSGLVGLDREDAIVETYCRRVREECRFKYVVSAVVLDPLQSKTHYHLIYGTRSPKGLRVFREVEKKAMEVAEAARAEAQQRDRGKGGQREMFGAEVLAKDYYHELRDRYLARSRRVVEAFIREKKRVLFDEIQLVALQQPMTWAADVMSWLEEWRLEGKLRYEGLSPRGRKPQEESDHYIAWTGS